MKFMTLKISLKLEKLCRVCIVLSTQMHIFYFALSIKCSNFSSLIGCSYYAARSMARDANLVFCPYNYIVNPVIRGAMEVDIKDAIVVLDEAQYVTPLHLYILLCCIIVVFFVKSSLFPT